MKLGKSIFIFLMFATGLTVFILGARHTPSPAPDGFTVVQYWEKWTGEEGEAIQQIVTDFNNTVGKQKHIYVQCVSISSIDQKTMVAIAGGVPPDVAGLWDTQLNNFAALNALEPLDDLAAAHGITAATYKPIYWKSCTSYKGRLWGVISTPATVALHYNKQLFKDRAADLRAAGLDPDRAPQSIDEVDRYADALTTYEPGGTGSNRRMKSTGFLPMEPGWYVNETAIWFGGEIFDNTTGKLQLTSEPMRKAFDWVASYPKKYGKDAITEFRSGVANFASAQNPFFTGDMAMEIQGPWMANYIENLAPTMNRWNVPPEKLKREQDFKLLTSDMSEADVITLLGPGSPAADDKNTFTWDAGVRVIHATFDANHKLAEKHLSYTPAEERKSFTQWGAVPFPSAIPGQKDVTYCPFDCLVIPRGSRHKAEAFEFIAYVTQQPVMEKLCSLHCKNSPLAKVSEDFVKYHPNPYIDVFDRLADSPNAYAVPAIPIWPEVNDEMTVTAQKIYLLEKSPELLLEALSERCKEKWSSFKAIQQARVKSAEVH